MKISDIKSIKWGEHKLWDKGKKKGKDIPVTGHGGP
jgi:hypothetical protein